MTNQEQQDRFVSITSERDGDKRDAMIDELSGPDAREMLKQIFHTIRSDVDPFGSND